MAHAALSLIMITKSYTSTLLLLLHTSRCHVLPSPIDTDPCTHMHFVDMRQPHPLFTLVDTLFTMLLPHLAYTSGAYAS